MTEDTTTMSPMSSPPPPPPGPADTTGRHSISDEVPDSAHMWRHVVALKRAVGRPPNTVEDDPGSGIQGAIARIDGRTKTIVEQLDAQKREREVAKEDRKKFFWIVAGTVATLLLTAGFALLSRLHLGP